MSGDAVESVARWLYRRDQDNGIAMVGVWWADAPENLRWAYHGTARRLLSECFPSPDRPAPDTEPEP